MTTDNWIAKADAEEEARLLRDTPYSSHWEWLRLLKGQGHTMAVAIIEAKQQLDETIDDGEWQRAEALIKLLAWLHNWPPTTLVDDVFKDFPAWAEAKRAEKRIDVAERQHVMDEPS